MLTGEQLRAGRAMLGWEQSELAERADVSLKTIKRMEATCGYLDARSTWAVKNALEIGGIEFLEGDGDRRTRGDGVRFCKDRTAKLRRDLVEDIGRWLDVTLKLAVDKDEDFFERPIEEVADKIVDEMREGMKDKLQNILRRDV